MLTSALRAVKTVCVVGMALSLWLAWVTWLGNVTHMETPGTICPARKTLHVLKTAPEPLDAVLSGKKPWEFRFLGDREIAVGDVLLLVEWSGGRYGDREALVEVTYILRGPVYGIPAGYGILTIQRVRPGR